MSEKLSRREFLRTAAQGAGVGFVASFLSPRLRDFLEEKQSWEWDETFKIYFKEKKLNYDSASQLARRFDNLWEATTPELLPAIKKDVLLWIDEMAPFFESNGIFKKVRLPDTVISKKFLDGDDHTGLLGSSDCESYIKFNYRFFNPYSAWEGNPILAAVVTHEFDHIQQGDACNASWYGDDSIERHAQASTYEVLASMANGGNEVARTSLIYMLRREFFRASWGLAEREGRMDEFWSLCESIHNPKEKAIIEQDRRDYEAGQASPQMIFDTYSITPLREIMKAYFEGKDYPQINVLNVEENSSSFQPGRTFVFHSFPLDDLFYFLKNAEETA